MDAEGETSVKDSPHSRRTGTDAATDAIGNQAPETAAELATGSGAPQPRERTLEQALGQQVRALRRDLDLTVSDLASAAGIAVGTLSKIENGLISPSLATLQAISTVLNVPISSLFTSFEEKRDCSYVQAGGGVRIERRGTKVGHQYELLGHALSVIR